MMYICQAGQIYSRCWYDLAHAAGWDPYNLHDLAHVFAGLDLYHADPAILPERQVGN